MRTKAIAGAAVAALLTGWMGAANAASVTFLPDSTSVTSGQTVTFTYAMDFSDDSTFGGGTDFWYDNTVLQFVGWSFDPGGTDDAFYQRAPDDCTVSGDAGCGFDANEFGPGLAQLNGLAWGNDSGAGISGPEVIGQMQFLVIGSTGDTAQIFMAANDDGVAGNPGPFVSGNSFTIQQVDFVGGSVTVVPIPAAAWLLISGLGALGGLRRFA